MYDQQILDTVKFDDQETFDFAKFKRMTASQKEAIIKSLLLHKPICYDDIEKCLSTTDSLSVKTLTHIVKERVPVATWCREAIINKFEKNELYELLDFLLDRPNDVKCDTQSALSHYFDIILRRISTLDIDRLWKVIKFTDWRTMGNISHKVYKRYIELLSDEERRLLFRKYYTQLCLVGACNHRQSFKEFLKDFMPNLSIEDAKQLVMHDVPFKVFENSILDMSVEDKNTLFKFASQEKKYQSVADFIDKFYVDLEKTQELVEELCKYPQCYKALKKLKHNFRLTQKCLDNVLDAAKSRGGNGLLKYRLILKLIIDEGHATIKKKHLQIMADMSGCKMTTTEKMLLQGYLNQPE